MALFEAVSNRIRRGWFKGEPAPDVALTREHSWSPAGGLAFRTCVATMSKGQGETLALILIGMLGLSGCATSRPEMAWVRTDGRRILDDPALLSKGETDIALCNANLDSGAAGEGARKCMGLKGYALVPKDQAEDARAGFAATQRGSRPSAPSSSK
jgi:hypothetical protein